MLFQTEVFFVFFAVVYFLYIISDHRRQNGLLLAASFVFYGWWDWRFLGLLAVSILADFILSKKIEDAAVPSARKSYLALSLVINLGILGVFKYFNFFMESFRALTEPWGVFLPLPVLKVVLPVGISFYTFQSLSYVIDVYRRQIPACRSLRDYGLFVSFFPQLVAGPIERASRLLRQIENPRVLSVENFKGGCFLFFWGMFQKIYVADGLARHVQWAFDGTQASYSAAQAAVGAVAFSWQIYGDFAGYSNMARGLARMMGFELMINFDNPYFSASLREFWRRWHISLSLWIRDYIYIPMGARSGGVMKQFLVLLASLTLAGLWHGAAWTFVVWGAYHGLLLGFERLFLKTESPRGLALRGVRTLLVFLIAAYGFLIFRAHSMTQVWDMTQALFCQPFSGWAQSQARLKEVFYLIAPLGWMEFLEVQTGKKNLIASCSPWIRWIFYLGIFHLMLYSGVPSPKQFIYFQF